MHINEEKDYITRWFASIIFSHNCYRVAYFDERSTGQMIYILVRKKKNIINVILKQDR
jgi:hypothetical protein